MTDDQVFLPLMTRCDSCVAVSREFSRASKGSIRCSVCGRLDRQRWYPKPVDAVVTDIPPKCSMNTIGFTAVRVLLVELLEALLKLRADGVVGTVVDHMGHVRGRWRTLYFQDHVVQFGPKPMWTCEGCGLRAAPNRGIESWLSTEEVGSRDLVQSAVGVLYVRKSRIGDLRLDRWPDVFSPEEVVVRDP